MLQSEIKLVIKDDYEEIRPDQTPTKDKWRLTPMYKVSANGNTMEWRIEFDGVKNLRTVHGDIITSDGSSGVMTSTVIEVIPKANRNMQEQALLEARSRYKDKFLSDGYRPAGSQLPNDCEPALANIWVPHAVLLKAKEERSRGTQDKKIDPKWRVIDRWPVGVSAKLDGIRMLSKLIDRNVRCRSRRNRVFFNLQHIEKELVTFFAYLPAEAELDGELYSHDMSFQEITSAVKTVKTKHPRLEEVKYFIFDIITAGDLPYEDRYNLLAGAYNNYINDGNQNTSFLFVPIVLANNDDEILSYHQAYVEAGYEGIIIRKLANANPTQKALDESRYHPGRSSNLLKYKEFTDEEAIVIGIDKATGSEDGAAMLIVQDIRGNRFPIRMRGSINRRREWYQNPNLVMNKPVTIRYQELTKAGIPRFPVGIAIRDYE
ncbi:MAG: hypothetical protein K6T88_14005 [Bacillus sp. (in: Bacteria)]|nr:hypothetical protein [Bacillus sp. (in: firmicutes)]